MTAYSLSAAPPSTTVGKMGVKAGAYTIKINQVKFDLLFSFTTGTGGGSPFYYYWKVYRVASASQSGGTSMVPVPLRSGAPAASATAAQNAVTYSGTTTTLQILAAGGSGVGVTQVTYQPPLDLTLQPGEAFFTDGYVGSATSGNTFSLYPTIFFEELRLDWST